MLDRKKIQGMLIGGAIGDAWGMGVETWTPEKIKEVHPEGLPRFVAPIGHKWFDAEKHPPGTTTDDTQLTIATMRGLIDGKAEADKTGSFDSFMDAIAKAHCDALKETDAGWGKSTREAIRRLQNGVSWRHSGKTSEKHRGTGNGVPMKISPLGAWYATSYGANMCDANQGFSQQCVNYSAMTHYTQMSACSGIAQAHAVYQCLWSSPDSFQKDEFIDLLCQTIWEGRLEENRGDHTFYDVSHLNETDDELQTQYEKLAFAKNNLTSEKIDELFGPGSCYVYESLPFSHAWFVKDCSSMQVLQQVVEAGGDTDTNAKMVGELIGALHGIELFEQPENKWAMEMLGPISDQLINLSDEFCNAFF